MRMTMHRVNTDYWAFSVGLALLVLVVTFV
jgi:hypothetical protein